MRVRQVVTICRPDGSTLDVVCTGVYRGGTVTFSPLLWYANGYPIGGKDCLVATRVREGVWVVPEIGTAREG